MSRALVGLFPDSSSAWAARRLLRDVGYGAEHITMLSAVDDDIPPLRQRPECIFR